MKQTNIGLVGLAVMGRNLARNIADHGFAISACNHTTGTREEFAAKHPDTPGGRPQAARSLKMS